MIRKASLAVVIALFGVLVAPTVARAERTVTITGGGWGHGIGMSQYGAYGRALNGRSADEILEHYYSGARVTSEKMPKVRVGLLQERGSIKLASSSHLGGSGAVVWKVAGESRELASGGPGVRWRVEPSATGGMRLYQDDQQVKRAKKGVFGDSSTPLVLLYEKQGSLIDVTGKTYNYALGKLRVGTYATDRCAPGFCLRLVLAIGMQKYLYGLAEVPSSWPAAVLRSQAIAGRTYAYEKWSRSGSHRYPCDCTVYDSVIDQAYAGDGKRTGSGSFWADWQAAVNDTNGRVAIFNGQAIQALYSSSSGGHTEDNENVWGGTPLPYLRGVKDNPDAVDANPNHEWDPVKMSFSAFEDKLQAAYGMGELQKFDLVPPFGSSGRVTVVNDDGTGGVRIVGSKKTVRVSGWSFRTAFGSSILKDTLYRIEIAFAVDERFLATYRKLDKAPGKPTGSSYAVPRDAETSLGRAQDFEKGRMTWRKETDKVVWQWGPVLKRYNGIGREGSKLGMPTSGIWGKPGRFSGASYVNGVIMWSEPTGAHHIRDIWFTAFSAVGGRPRMGLPTSDVTKIDGAGSRQRLTKGTLYKPPQVAEVFALWGDIDERYRALGGVKSKCGAPTSSMVKDDAGAAAAFENGSIVWSSTQGVKVHCS
jgi:SpoIID/LytB domain protein